MIRDLVDFATTQQALLLVGALVSVWLFVECIVWYLNRKSARKALKDSLTYVLLHVAQTRHVSEKEKTLSVAEQISRFEELVNAMVVEEKPITFEVAVPNQTSDIHFFVAVPSEYVESAKNQIHRIFERAQVQESPDYTVFARDGSAVIAEATLKKFFGLPVQTYKKSGVDVFASIITMLTDVKEVNTGIMVQVVLRRASEGRRGAFEKVLRALRRGDSMSYAAPQSVFDFLTGFIASSSKEKKEPTGSAAREIEAIEEKSLSLLYEANVRVAVSAETKERADLLFTMLQARFEQFGVAGRNSFEFRKRDDKKTRLNLIFRLFAQKTAMTLSVEEVASVFHFPSAPIEVSTLHWLKTKRIAAPTGLAKQGLLLGENIFHGEKTEVRMPEQDRLRHVYVVGQTGTGKTSLIKSMAYQDIRAGNGVCIIDPHGDLVDDMLSVISEDRLDDVILFDPSNVQNPLGLNMLEYNRARPQEKTFIVNEILAIFYSLFDRETMGPVFEQYMRNALLLLMEGKTDEPATLMEVPRVLTDTDFRSDLLSNCENKPVIDFWEEEAQKVAGEASLENIAPYITSKFNNFITNDYIRPIIEQPYSAFSFRKVMDEGKLLFIRLPKGTIGELNAKLLGMITTGKMALAAFSRDDIPERERRHFYFYIDEFQNFTTDSIATILSEARKYHLSLTVAHQYMAQLSDSIRGAVLGNVGSTIVFRVGIEDAKALEEKFAPQFAAAELAELENLNCVVGMLSDNAPLPPFTMHIRFMPSGTPAIKDMVTQYVTEKHKKVERE